MLTQATIILPNQVGGGWAVSVRELERTMCSHWNGFTKTNGHGSWVDDNGETISEPVLVYTIAAEWTPSAIARLERLAEDAAEMLDQDCIYTATHAGVVLMNNLTRVSKAA